MQKYQESLQNRQGDVIAGAVVSVTIAGTVTPATLFSDNGVTLITQQITTDANGYFSFYAANGKYDITFTGATFALIKWRDVDLFDFADANIISPAALAGAGGAALVGYGARTVAAKFGEVVSVKDAPFNAAGDGVTDDTSAIAAAIDAVLAKPYGATLHVPAGRYKLSSTITRNLTKQLFIRGEGKASQFFGATAFGYLFAFTATANAAYGSVFRDFMLSPALTGRTSGFDIANGNTFVFDGVTLQGQDNPFRFANSYAVRIRCTFDVAASEAVRFTTSAHHADLSESKFYSCGIINSKPAISFEVASNNLILDRIDCEVNYKAISLNSCTSVRINGSYIENNTANDIDFLGTCVGVSIEDTWLYGGNTAFTISNVNGLSFKRNTIGKVVNFGTGVANLDVDICALVPGGVVNVNYWSEQGATLGGTPILMPDGPDTDIQARVSSKGAADIVGYTGSQSVLAFVAIHVPGAVNYVRFEPATTGLPASVRGFGETNAGLRLIARGTGVINAASPFRFDGNVGFYTTAPIAKQTATGSRGGNVALASLLTALAAYGLITDSTTA